MLAQKRGVGFGVHNGVAQLMRAGKELALLRDVLVNVDYFKSVGLRIIAAHGA